MTRSHLFIPSFSVAFIVLFVLSLIFLFSFKEMDSQFIVRDVQKEDCKTLTVIFKKTFPYYADHDIYDKEKLFQRIQTGTCPLSFFFFFLC